MKPTDSLPYQTGNFDPTAVFTCSDKGPVQVAKARTKTNAKFIKVACNSHNDLVKAVEHLLCCMRLAKWENDPTAIFARKVLMNIKKDKGV